MKHTMMKVLSVVIALTMIMGTFGMVVFATECAHENCAETKVPATCGTYGYTLYECEDCGYSYAANLIAKADECNPDSAVEIPAVDAQCGTSGHGAYTAGSYCSDCGEILVAPEFIEGSEIECEVEVVLVPATCDKPYNEVKLVCSVCETEYNSINLDNNPEWGNNLFDGDGEHNYVYEITVEPTCVKNGTAVVTCEQCDVEAKEIRVLKNETLHDWVDVSVKNTCTTDGQLGFECDNEGCDAVAGKDATTGDVVVGGRIVTLFKTGHNFVTDLTVDDLIDDCTAVDQAATCTKPGYTHKLCSNEGCLEYSKVQHEDLSASHQWPFTIVDGEMRDIDYDYYTVDTGRNCTTDGEDTYRCMVPACTATGTVIVPKTGHLVTYTYSCGEGCAVGECDDCTHDYRVLATKTCMNANCPGGELDDPKGLVEATAHAWVYGDNVVGTCVSLAYKTAYCGNAGCNQELAAHAEDIPDSKDPNNHVDVYESKAAEEPTCKKAGWTVEEACRACGEIVTASEPQPKLAECLEEDIEVDLNWVTRSATCTTPAEYVGRCKVCDEVYKSVIVDEDDRDPDNHVYYEADGTEKTALVYVPYKAPTCTEDGNHAYIKCAACEIADDPATKDVDETFVYTKEISADKFGADKTFEDITAGFGAADAEVDDCDRAGCAHNAIVIEKLGHDSAKYGQYNAETEKWETIPETCTTPGMVGGEVCDRCGYKSNENAGKVIAPHGKFNGTSYVFDPNGFYVNDKGETFYNYVIDEDKPASCTEEGETAGEYCMICRKGDLTAHVVPKLDHDVQIIKVVPADCTNAGYTVHKCVNCETIAETVPDASSATGTREILCWYIDGYTKALGHDFSVVIDDEATCTTPSKTGKGCANYDAESEVVYGPAVKGHKVGSEYVDLSCAGIVAFIGNSCDVCGEYISMADMTHDIAAGEEAPTCTETGKLIFACVDCGLHFVDAEGSALTPGKVAPDGTVLVENGTFAIEIPALGHEIGLVVEFVMPTPDADGYVVFQCATCGENMEPIEIPYVGYEDELGLDLEVTPYNTAIGAYDDFAVNTGKIAVTLTMDAAEFEYKILNFKFGFNTDKLTFAGYTVNYEFDVTQAVETKAYATGGYVNVISRSTTPVTVEEVAPNVMIDGEDVAFITLFFTVKRDMAPHNFDVDVVGDVDNSVWVEAVDYMKETEEGLVSKTDKCLFVIDDEFDLDVYSLGDVSYDDEINLGDLVALTDMLYTADAEYCATADINRDGVINIVDIALLENYLLTNRTYEDYIAMVG